MRLEGCERCSAGGGVLGETVCMSSWEGGRCVREFESLRCGDGWLRRSLRELLTTPCALAFRTNALFVPWRSGKSRLVL